MKSGLKHILSVVWIILGLAIFYSLTFGMAYLRCNSILYAFYLTNIAWVVAGIIIAAVSGFCAVLAKLLD